MTKNIQCNIILDDDLVRLMYDIAPLVRITAAKVKVRDWRLHKSRLYTPLEYLHDVLCDNRSRRVMAEVKVNGVAPQNTLLPKISSLHSL